MRRLLVALMLLGGAAFAATAAWGQQKDFSVMVAQMLYPQSGPYRRGLRELVYAALVHWSGAADSSH